MNIQPSPLGEFDFMEPFVNEYSVISFSRYGLPVCENAVARMLTATIADYVAIFKHYVSVENETAYIYKMSVTFATRALSSIK